MKDSRTRDMMSKLYRLVEKYEEVPLTKYADTAQKWFDEAYHDVSDLYNEYKDNEFANALLTAFYGALEKRFSAVNKMPLADRPKEPMQLTMC